MANAVTIKLFQSLRQFYEIRGFYPSQLPNQSSQFNAKNLSMLFSIIQYFSALIAVFLFTTTTSITEHADSLYMCLTCGACTTHVLTHIYKIGQILQLIENFEKFIEKSESSIFSSRDFFCFKKYFRLEFSQFQECLHHIFNQNT